MPEEEVKSDEVAGGAEAAPVKRKRTTRRKSASVTAKVIESEILSRSPFRDHASDEEHSSIDLQKVLLGIRRHVGVVLLVVALMAFSGWGVAYYLSSRYVADAFLIYRETESAKLGGTYRLTQYSLDTVLEMMRLPSHYRAVKSVLGLKESVSELMDRTWVEAPDGQSNLIKVACKANDAQYAADIVNTLASILIRDSEEVRRGQLRKAHQYFRSRSAEVEKQLEDNQKLLAEFKVENPHFELNSGNSSLIDEVIAAESVYQKAALHYNQLLVEYENMKRQVTRFPDHTARREETSPLKERVASTELALLEARTRYAPSNPKVKVLEASLEELQRMLDRASVEPDLTTVFERNPLKEKLNVELMRFQGKLRAAKRQKQDLEKALIAKQAALELLPAEQMRYAKLRHKEAAAIVEKEGLDESLRSVEMLLALGRGDLELYQAADDSQQLKSRWDDIIPILPLLGAIVGLCGGFALAALFEVADRRLITPKQVEFLYQVPCLHAIPEVVWLHKRDAEREFLFYVRELFERLEVATHSSFKSLAILSATEGEGKSTIACQLALYLAKRLKQKTVVLTFDSVAAYPVASPESPLSDYLREQAPLSDVVSEGKFDLIVGGDDPDIKELLSTNVMTDLWKRLSRKYDRIIIDAPPVVEEVLSTTLARLAGQSIFVVSSAKTKRSLVDSALGALHQGGITPSGIVLNAVPVVYLSDERVKAERRRAAQDRWRSRKKQTAPVKKTGKVDG